MPRLGPAARASLAIALVGVAAVTGILAAGGHRSAPARPAPGLRANLLPGDLDGSRAPRIRLHDASGRTVDSAALRGRPYLVSFVYTRCRDVCPIIAEEIAGALRQLGPRARDVEALLVSVDPRHDTPAAARRWLGEHRLPTQARYLLGSSARLLPIWRDWYVVPSSGGAGFDPTTHDASVWLVDARGRLRGRWSGGESIAPGDVAHDLSALLARAHRTASA